ncbi:phosphodiester glycosidase family protein [Coleofasciculus sp. FACHB-129]|uniref:phosphodiester glycosidase family protein n=1 Tax=Cyanophyceae TaxID=3028117 RepID=UPI00168571FC|nr:phosphodiester glycosidase family protein [Coleofasciculus sp. FACHB-129]MBD1896963.1 phosphodiester glycosidase family protein [Coleofasciculus sp. FACHB-129]
MLTKAKFLSILLVTFIIVSAIHIYSKNASKILQVQVQKIINRENTANNLCDCQSQECQFSIEFIRTDHQGNTKAKGANYVLIFDPKSPKLDFKVSLALAHEIYAKDAKGRFRKEYVPKQFHEIIADDNAKLNGKKPIAAINGDYIDPENKPQGLNISRGVEYSGLFKDKRSSFGISGGAEERKATIQIGKRNEQNLNYNLVGGNGRFYKDGIFKDICNDLGEYACKHETSRSMAAITSKGYVILLVNNVETDGPLYPDKFDDVLKGISNNHCLGNIQEAMLFDGGFSTAFYYNDKIYVENSNPIGSVFLIYKTE